jgi:L-threonylcarbamoyladenylate synthase
MSEGPIPVPENLLEALEHLEADGLVAFPTETVWGLAARANSLPAVERLQAFKGRAEHHPISVLIDSPASLDSLGVALNPLLLAVAEAFWPGPLTLVVPGPDPGQFAAGIAGPNGAVGIRCSDHPLANMLVREALARGLGPLTATSFNRGGETPVETHSQAVLLANSDTRAAVITLQAGAHDAAGALPSTVLDLFSSEPKVLREGPISERELAKLFSGFR